jgi:hypothetical protein
VLVDQRGSGTAVPRPRHQLPRPGPGRQAACYAGGPDGRAVRAASPGRSRPADRPHSSTT